MSNPGVFDAQTSGGLALLVPERLVPELPEVRAMLQDATDLAMVIGHVLPVQPGQAFPTLDN